MLFRSRKLMRGKRLNIDGKVKRGILRRNLLEWEENAQSFQRLIYKAKYGWEEARRVEEFDLTVGLYASKSAVTQCWFICMSVWHGCRPQTLLGSRRLCHNHQTSGISTSEIPLTLLVSEAQGWLACSQSATPPSLALCLTDQHSPWQN